MGTRLLWLLGLALLSLGANCDTSLNPSIQVQEERSPATGTLQGITIDGSGFTPNGVVRISFFFRVLGGSALQPSAAEEIRADSNGSFHFVRRPMRCPSLSQGQRASWISVVANDVTETVSRVKELHPGRESDCVA
jgi:hypothetical protein